MKNKPSKTMKSYLGPQYKEMSLGFPLFLVLKFDNFELYYPRRLYFYENNI